ncbi:hypothetical protein EA187_05930 [Lujinxingia sediminis]|uniref:Uncharacterized protein n=1 Tax=Lujinxingia sediminis TaxID=2480984 RepID=A0ABY0CVI6_9DELT|nr:hypothetical protein [Lujinxingia sediminis]RVU46674.1 hypothetical protein EA187_05930 [Lujinxingia sediminis]
MATDAFTPTLDQLRGFVRKQVPADMRKSMYRWLVSCPDPALPTVIANLQFEWEQVQQDQRLPTDLRAVSEFFLRLWESEDASFDVFKREARPVQTLQYASDPKGFEGIHLWRRDDGSQIVDARIFEVDVEVPTCRGGHFTFVSTDADGLKKFDSGRSSNQPRPYKFERSDGRATFWYVAANDASVLGIAPTTPSHFLDWVRRIHGETGAIVSAVRLTSRVLSDLYD